MAAYVQNAAIEINRHGPTLHMMDETCEFKISQMVDNGQVVQLTLIENVFTEPISQKQIIMESLSKNTRLDSETRAQLIPVMQAILQAQPNIKVKSYRQTQVVMTMPKSRYRNIGMPKVGSIMRVDFKAI